MVGLNQTGRICVSKRIESLHEPSVPEISSPKPQHNAIQMAWRWWSTWQEGSVNRRIFAAIVTVGSLTVLVKVASAVKELVIAYRFGTSDALDAFLMALLLPHFVYELIGGAVTSAFIPTYVQVREREGQAAAQRLFSSIMVVSVGLAVIAGLVLGLLGPLLLPVLVSGFHPEKLALTKHLYFLLLPILLAGGLAAMWSAILNAGERFALVAVIPMVSPILTVLLLLMADQRDGIVVLTAATVMGLALEAGLLGWQLKKQGVSLIPRWYGKSPAVKQVFRQYTPQVGASFLMGSTMLIPQSIAATLGPGSVSVLAYGSKATALLLGVGSTAVSTAVLPHFSRMVAIGDSAGVRHTLKTYSQLILLVTLPLTAVFIYYSEPIVRIFLQRGAFTQADTFLVGLVQSIYLLQVPIYALSILCVRLISSFRASHLLLWGTIINLIMGIIFTYLFAEWFQVVGIAVAISLMHLLSMVYLLFAARRLVGRLSLLPRTA